jgi:phage-related minor tail protein
VTAEGTEAFSILDESTSIFLNTFDTAVNGVAQGTQSMSDAFENMTKAILLQIGKLLAIQGIGSALSGQGGFLGQLGASLLKSEQGNAFSGGSHLTAYAKGGVVNSPTIFPMKSGVGLMGESGSEAVLPLSRMSNGNLGVESSGMNVVINNNASGVSVVPRQTDDGLTIDVVMNAVSSAVRRGGNEIASSIEESYALNRGRGVYGS